MFFQLCKVERGVLKKVKWRRERRKMWNFLTFVTQIIAVPLSLCPWVDLKVLVIIVWKSVWLMHFVFLNLLKIPQKSATSSELNWSGQTGFLDSHMSSVLFWSGLESTTRGDSIMSSRSRKPTPFDRLLKQQCQKGVYKCIPILTFKSWLCIFL